MKVSELIDTVRHDYLADITLPYKWPDTILLQYANQAEREATRRAKLLFDDSTVTDSDIASGVATGTTVNKLIDSGADFVSASVLNKTVYNLTNNTFATITGYDSATQLTLSADIMTSGDVYVIGDPTKAISRVCVISGTSKYSLSNKIFKIGSCHFNSDKLPLEQKTIGWLDRNYYQWRSAEGNPVYYIEDKGSITLVPKPNSSLNSSTGKDTLFVSVYRLPLADMSLQTDGEPEIPEEYHIDLLDWMLHLAYRRDNPQLSMIYAESFKGKFGAAPSALVENNIRSLPSNFRLEGAKW